MKNLKITGKFMVALVLAVGTASTAQAQFAADNNAATDISSDSLEYQGAEVILTGGVDVRQGDVRVLSDKMVITTSDGGVLSGTNISRIVADGNFYYLTATQEVRGEKGVYTRIDDTFVVTGNVILKQDDGSIVTGDKLFYNLTTQQARVVGTCQGRKCGSKGRVNILIKSASDVSSDTSAGGA